MLQLLVTLLPMMLFWNLVAIYLGGWPVDAKGGSGLTQTIGLILSFILFVVVWKGLHAALMPVGEVLGGIVITSFVTVALLPLLAWIGFKLVGVTIAPSHGHH